MNDLIKTELLILIYESLKILERQIMDVPDKESAFGYAYSIYLLYSK